MEKPKQDRLGRLLLQNNLVTEEQLKEAAIEHEGTGKSLGRVLIDNRVLTEGQLTSVLAEQIGIDYADLNSYKIDPAAATLIDANLARRHMVCPIDYKDGKLVVAMADPTNVFALDDLRIMTGMEVLPVVSTRDDIEGVIGRYLHSTAEIDDAFDEVSLEEFEEEEDEEDLIEAGEEAPIVKYVNLIISEAVNENASDVHIEPSEKDVRVRYRVDGVLHEIRKSPKKIHPGLVSRIKIMAKMNIAERRIPQDGRFSTIAGDKAVDLRVASLPTVYGEKVVLRILDRSSIMISLSNLGMEEGPLELFTTSFEKPYGTCIVTGPTGSGKTTTLYAALGKLNRREVNVITVEDPVEYQLHGLNQVQVNTKVGLTFAASLRSILRCDPDIVMIGEIRDGESAKMAIESALTGHMVLCTLHTNDAPSAVTRMIEMGVEPFLIASAVDCVVSQRLGRRLCTRCREEAEYDQEYLEKKGFPLEGMEDLVIYRASKGGCAFCNHAGYRGRVGIYEVLVVSEDIEKLVVSMATSRDIGELAREKGMKTLREDGFGKVREGITSIEEVLRVVM
ncbi:MAG: Flp pilus assembly complex ATPase component TadA [Actinobacteria bacterium]|nr:Flp pilus assembly complex ATPase component TadA [Actinomycetota bacterium]MCG2819965.1 Flp pilus assembly complex ATPase component TadA [Actinomycetes bacterium]MBU4179825.1 Flp pilus assembly complex ATPase component TadA [Actinomycetota bacterium]MBU4218946.1 Flp pilus assembly complex ATPase component TadA [Actinomycetota bacterium]MBU4357961.1 Flp pilus assembly complex ATPase component TadA [Actinomycetota bacterium]